MKPISTYALVLLSLLFTHSEVRADNVYSQTMTGSVSFLNPDPIVLTFAGAPPAASDATLTLIATTGELAGGFNKRLENLSVEGDSYTTPGVPGLTPGYMLPTTQTQEFYTGSATALPEAVLIPLADLNNYVLDGQVVVSVDDPSFIAGGNFEMTLSYISAVPEPCGSLFIVIAAAGSLVRRRRTSVCGI